MNSLLKHMVDITGHRDHAMLDISVIAAVQELAGAAQVRVLTLVAVGGQHFLRPRAAVGAGAPAHVEEAADAATPGEPVAALPELQQ
ncbi:MAG: GGDEF domain-containing protein, partial [Massilia sp.]